MSLTWIQQIRPAYSQGLIFVCYQEKFISHIHVITPDQSFWISATKMAEISNLKVVLFLIGFHTIKSFAGSTCIWMLRSGVSFALEFILSGFSQAYAIRKHTRHVSRRKLFGRIRSHNRGSVFPHTFIERSSK